MTLNSESPSPLNAGEPAGLGGNGGNVTLVEGGTFSLSDRLGDIEPGKPQGLFFRDARVISRWELMIDGKRPEPLSVLSPEAFAAPVRGGGGGRGGTLLTLAWVF